MKYRAKIDNKSCPECVRGRHHNCRGEKCRCREINHAKAKAA